MIEKPSEPRHDSRLSITRYAFPFFSFLARYHDDPPSKMIVLRQVFQQGNTVVRRRCLRFFKVLDG